MQRAIILPCENQGTARLEGNPRFLVPVTSQKTMSIGEVLLDQDREDHEVPTMTEITRSLALIERGEASAAEQLLPLIYDELRRLAAHKLAQEKTAQTLHPTALVHEAYLRLLGNGDAAGRKEQYWDNRGQFFRAMAETMRRILIDRAREKRSQKRGDGRQKFDVDAMTLASQATPDQLVAIDDALAKLVRLEPEVAQVVELRYFGGLTMEEAGKVLGISSATAYRHWKYARAWLHSELLGEFES
jgi:RNA polymerase sigma factor (TIGR02999 family)